MLLIKKILQSPKHFVGNKSKNCLVPNKLRETKQHRRKSQTDCGKQNKIDRSLKQIAQKKMQLQEVSNNL